MEGIRNLSTGEFLIPNNASLANDLSSSSIISRVGKILACSVVLVISFVGNILLILVVHKNANMKKTINYFIVNMAVSDLVVPIVILPRVIVQEASGRQTWLAMEGAAGNIMCKLMFFFSDVTMVVSILSLLCISMDRFCAVVFPMKLSLITSRVRIGLMAFTWTFSVFYFAPFLYGFKLMKINGETHCLLQWSEDISFHLEIQRAAAIASCILFTLVPCVLLTVMYSAILIVTRSTIIKGENGNGARSRRQANNIKLLKLAVLTVVGFAFCYGPFNVFLFYATLILNWNISTSEALRTFLFAAQFLTYTNSALNPCLYFIFIENYRRGLQRVLKIGRPKTRKNTLLASRNTTRSRLDRKSPNQTSTEDQEIRYAHLKPADSL
ncbi:QRFP-like peptide receptor [Actinia tenebrosa]|uniref:QRFP-like peptide receptor n=1 Tax=Actinia tenebrosa TaxID=6105 RepID=A0A6P8HU25_ACTTE|nr:QRFP-like peptide receptor [Actinia tenebrosa]